MQKGFILILFFIAVASRMEAQRELPDIASHFYRVNPFEKDFSKFISALVSDPGLSSKEVIKRSDTSFFFFKGTYKTFNPFTFLPTRTEIILAEQVQQFSDSLPDRDTFLIYQVLGYTEGGENGADAVKKEYNRFNRLYKSVFDAKNNSDIGSAGNISGQVTNYFFSASYLSPMTVAWGLLPAKHENVFALSIRLKIMENRSVLAGIPYQTE
jgi:hypothetical protein